MPLIIAIFGLDCRNCIHLGSPSLPRFGRVAGKVGNHVERVTRHKGVVFYPAHRQAMDYGGGGKVVREKRRGNDRHIPHFAAPETELFWQDAIQVDEAGHGDKMGAADGLMFG